MSEVNLQFTLTKRKKPCALSITFNLDRETPRNKRLLKEFIRYGDIEGFVFATPDREVLGIEFGFSKKPKSRKRVTSQ